MTNNRMNFSGKKKLLLKTRAQFDGSSSDPPVAGHGSEEPHSQVVSVIVKQASPNSLVIQALIYQVCVYMEQDLKKRELLYTTICKMLSNHKFCGLNFALSELCPLREQYYVGLSRFFSQVHEQISQRFGTHTASLSADIILDNIRTDYHTYRYQQNFQELESIAEGGFGVVYKARNKIDGITYAVKKIKFIYTNDIEYEKVLREVRSFAQLKHPNIVNYNNSWVEPNSVTGSTVYRKNSDSESFTTESNEYDSSLKTRNSENHEVVPVFEISSESSADCFVEFRENIGNSNLCVSSCTAPVNTEAHSLMVNSESYVWQQNVVIEENHPNNLTGTSEMSIEQQFIEMKATKFSSSELHHFSGLPYHYQEPNDDILDETESKDSEYVRDSLVNEHQFNIEKPLLIRRRRHSSGPTCSTVDQDFAADCNDKGISGQRVYNRVNSLDLNRCTELVPKRNDVKWDISNLDVMAVLYIQMELCDKSLRDFLEERASTPSTCECDVKSTLKMFRQIVQGVEHIHSKYIIHRDLKPTNIFLCNDGLIKIGDFGLAALCTKTDDEVFHTSRSCSHTQGVGTAPYSAPEQANQGKNYNYNCKVDIYSLGIIFIELLYNFKTRCEFFDTVDKITKGSIPLEFVNIWPKEVVNLIRRLVSTDPQERPEAKEVLRCLQPLQDAEPLAITSCHMCEQNEEKRKHEALKNCELNQRIRALENQLSEKDKTIRELQLKLLLYSCDT